MQEKQVVIIQEFNQIPPSEQYTGNISIIVEDPQLKDSYFTYKIIGTDREGPFQIRRRYSDFDLLRKKMCQRWLGIYIPPISGKRSEDNLLHVFKVFDDKVNEAKYAETRKKFLRYFCQGLAVRPYLYYCDLFQLFLRGGPDYETAINHCLNKEYGFLLNAYEMNFNNLMVILETVQLEDKLGDNQKSLVRLRQSQKLLQNICQKMFKASQSRNQYNEQFNLVMSKTIPEYEEECYLGHLNKNREKLIVKRSEAFEEELNRFKTITAQNPIQKFLEMAMYEIREVKAFIEAIEGRKEAEKRKCELKQKISEKENQKKKLERGEFSFRSLFKGGTKDSQIEEIDVKLEVLRKELTCIEKMIVMMILNTNYELEEYRLRRGREYSEVFKKVGELELVEIGAYEQLLKIPLVVLQ